MFNDDKVKKKDFSPMISVFSNFRNIIRVGTKKQLCVDYLVLNFSKLEPLLKVYCTCFVQQNEKKLHPATIIVAAIFGLLYFFWWLTKQCCFEELPTQTSSSASSELELKNQQLMSQETPDTDEKDNNQQPPLSPV